MLKTKVAIETSVIEGWARAFDHTVAGHGLLRCGQQKRKGRGFPFPVFHVVTAKSLAAQQNQASYFKIERTFRPAGF
jgi:hypothetical protein